MNMSNFTGYVTLKVTISLENLEKRAFLKLESTPTCVGICYIGIFKVQLFLYIWIIVYIQLPHKRKKKSRKTFITQYKEPTAKHILNMSNFTFMKSSK